jgi:ADP-dependent NAD(P)H-hydrate dehydratase
MIPLQDLSEEYLRSHGLPAHDDGGGKESRGRVLVVSGNANVPGAAILTGVSALRAGAGILQIATGISVAPHIGVVVPEAMVVGFSETSDGEIDPSNASDIGSLAAEADAVVVGPGMMEEESLRAIVTSVLANGETSRIVLDAAAFTCMKDHSGADAHLGRAVVTPHAGEMARFLGIERSAVEKDPLGAACQASTILGGVVVMKGAETIVIGDGAWRSTFGSVALATSGSGDVLAGIIGGLLARGAPPTLAALWGVFLHGQAGHRLAEKHGNVGALARELPNEIPRLMMDLNRSR